uniref:Uncharacterized protein n=1 Tax=Chromera velia CCMP2878 TaxID=1169474 RepID=A0A0G4HI39_9ALVE|eukprot:Cvel_1053.t1-p1 / transcript=Cvel_1053.t1 / gene=Cvel_1053 / organism=Chromera_velia_CCMP2878 / gene_product=hypothetical protein / transcript_product=hypothetical protein / location=Cvel_scaffold34:80076-87330(+) / protein_length=937 / sequence_SO=supercontig / SO=protein_coding / is_pseudo=false
MGFGAHGQGHGGSHDFGASPANMNMHTERSPAGAAFPPHGHGQADFPDDHGLNHHHDDDHSHTPGGAHGYGQHPSAASTQGHGHGHGGDSVEAHASSADQFAVGGHIGDGGINQAGGSSSAGAYASSDQPHQNQNGVVEPFRPPLAAPFKMYDCRDTNCPGRFLVRRALEELNIGPQQLTDEMKILVRQIKPHDGSANQEDRALEVLKQVTDKAVGETGTGLDEMWCSDIFCPFIPPPFQAMTPEQNDLQTHKRKDLPDNEQPRLESAQLFVMPNAEGMKIERGKKESGRKKGGEDLFIARKRYDDCFRYRRMVWHTDQNKQNIAFRYKGTEMCFYWIFPKRDAKGSRQEPSSYTHHNMMGHSHSLPHTLPQSHPALVTAPRPAMHEMSGAVSGFMPQPQPGLPLQHPGVSPGYDRSLAGFVQPGGWGSDLRLLWVDSDTGGGLPVVPCQNFAKRKSLSVGNVRFRTEFHEYTWLDQDDSEVLDDLKTPPFLQPPHHQSPNQIKREGETTASSTNKRPPRRTKRSLVRVVGSNYRACFVFACRLAETIDRTQGRRRGRKIHLGPSVRERSMNVEERQATEHLPTFFRKQEMWRFTNHAIVVDLEFMGADQNTETFLILILICPDPLSGSLLCGITFFVENSAVPALQADEIARQLHAVTMPHWEPDGLSAWEGVTPQMMAVGVGGFLPSRYGGFLLSTPQQLSEELGAWQSKLELLSRLSQEPSVWEQFMRLRSDAHPSCLVFIAYDGRTAFELSEHERFLRDSRKNQVAQFEPVDLSQDAFKRMGDSVVSHGYTSLFLKEPPTRAEKTGTKGEGGGSSSSSSASSATASAQAAAVAVCLPISGGEFVDILGRQVESCYSPNFLHRGGDAATESSSTKQRGGVSASSSGGGRGGGKGEDERSGEPALKKVKYEGAEGEQPGGSGSGSADVVVPVPTR